MHPACNRKRENVPRFYNHAFVEGDAGRIGVGDAGTDIADVLCGQVFLQLFV